MENTNEGIVGLLREAFGDDVETDDDGHVVLTKGAAAYVSAENGVVRVEAVCWLSRFNSGPDEELLNRLLAYNDSSEGYFSVSENRAYVNYNVRLPLDGLTSEALSKAVACVVDMELGFNDLFSEEE